MLVLAALVASVSCGTRLSASTIRADALGTGGGFGARGAGGNGAGGSAGVTDDTGGSARVGGAPGATSGGGGSDGGNSAAAAAMGARPRATSQTTSGVAPVPKGAPIVIGNLGAYSGIGASAWVGARDAMQAWVAKINATGGIAGHPVRLVIGDDGQDSAKGYAEVRDMVENQHVIALVGSVLVNSGGAVRPYLEQRRIPVIGGDVTDEFWHRSQMFFPQVEYSDNLSYGIMAATMADGHRKVALLYCVESQACAAGIPHEQKAVAELGGSVVYTAQISIAQPDFTAECLNAQSKGATSLFAAADANTIGRIANSCARQGYHPQFGAGGAELDASLSTNAVLDGLEGATQTFPWFLTAGSPAIEEYGATMHGFAPGAQLEASTTLGWTSAKLFEEVARNSIGPGDAPSSERLLHALWGVHADTLGGLVPPITFMANQPAVKTNCSYRVAVRSGAWVAPQGLTQMCGNA